MSEHNTHNSFLEAYEMYADDIFRFCMSKTSNRDDALDITQETFAKTWEYLENDNTVDNIRAFLYRVARNRIYDFYRKKKSESLDAAQEEGYEFESDDHERMVATSNARFSMKILQKLEDTDRELLIMRFIDELSIPEIADITNQKENTVSVQVHRALKKAQDIISQHIHHE